MCVRTKNSLFSLVFTLFSQTSFLSIQALLLQFSLPLFSATSPGPNPYLVQRACCFLSAVCLVIVFVFFFYLFTLQQPSTRENGAFFRVYKTREIGGKAREGIGVWFWSMVRVWFQLKLL